MRIVYNIIRWSILSIILNIFSVINAQNINPLIGSYTGSANLYSSTYGKTYNGTSCEIKIRSNSNNEIYVTVESYMGQSMHGRLTAKITASGKHYNNSFNLSTRNGNKLYTIRGHLRRNSLIGEAYKYRVGVNGRKEVMYKTKFNCEKKR